MENEELVQQIQAGNKPTENMEQLYLQNRSFIYQQAKKYSAYADMDDLMQEAYFGLYEAVERYQPDKEAKFITYLGYWIQSVLRRYIDRNRHIKRIGIPMMERISKYKRYIAQQQTQGVEPSDFAICRDLKITEMQLKNLRKAMYEAECISTSDLLPGADNLTVEDGIADPFDLEEQVVEEAAREQAENLIWQIVDELEERQAEIIIGHYKESATLKEIAERLNLSRARVGVIERNALSILRNKHEISDIAEIYGYMNAYQGTGYRAFKDHGSSVERMAIRHIEGEEKIKKLKQIIDQRKEEIQGILNIDELFSKVVNFASQ